MILHFPPPAAPEIKAKLVEPRSRTSNGKLKPWKLDRPELMGDDLGGAGRYGSRPHCTKVKIMSQESQTTAFLVKKQMPRYVP